MWILNFNQSFSLPDVLTKAIQQASLYVFADRNTHNMLTLLRQISNLAHKSKLNINRTNTSRPLSSYPDATPTTHATPLLHENLSDYKENVDSNDALYSLSFLSKPMRAKSIEKFFDKPFQWPRSLSIISFERCKMKDDGLLELCKHIIDAPQSLTMLNLAENDLTSKYIDEFAKAIAKTNINKINLNHNKINVQTLNDALKKHCAQGHTIVLWSVQGRHIITPNCNDSESSFDDCTLKI